MNMKGIICTDTFACALTHNPTCLFIQSLTYMLRNNNKCGCECKYKMDFMWQNPFISSLGTVLRSCGVVNVCVRRVLTWRSVGLELFASAPIVNGPCDPPGLLSATHVRHQCSLRRRVDDK